MVAALLVTTTTLAGCSLVGASREPTPTSKLCLATQNLVSAVARGRGSLSSASGGDLAQAQVLLDRAMWHRDHAQAAAGHAGFLFTHQEEPEPGFTDASADFGVAFQAVDLALMTLNPDAPPESVEARPVLLDDAATKIRAIRLPFDCTTLEAPLTTP